MNKPLLLFDFGGVLVDLDKPRVLSAFQRLGMDISPYLGTYKQAGIFSRLEEGSIGIPEFCEELRRLTSCPSATDEAIVDAWRSYLLTVPAERLDMLLKARQHYSVSLLSNTNPIHWQMAEETLFRYKGLTVSDFFDHIFLSCRLGAEKPAPVVFRKVVEGMGVPAADILFFDDSEVNCNAARECGLQALVAGPHSEWLKYFDNNGKLHVPSLSE